ncbi:ABC transporter ATP-binding protein [Anaeromicrobium sediminis]|uniref:Multidrug ABC transporter ATP-binding protein n=1 Tax=Anaeromicrobium sediminis TaxID=1478221 RepID=A0A267MJH3_9FIRM|nr:ABC transporter ATP-binding protein [Anaeromicrobium sediminis]PAB59025.1 hypothetical protein CCE28_12645 [Anaeromicrobium sediminis]
MKVKSSFRSLWKYLSIYKKNIFLILILILCTTLLSLAGPYLMGYLIDNGILKGNLDLVVKYLTILGFIYLLNSLSSWLQNYLMTGVAQNSVKKLREDVFEKVESLPLNYFDTRPIGDVMSRMTNDIDLISNSLTQTFIQVISSVLTVTGILIVMFSLNWILALSLGLSIPIILGLALLFSARVKDNFTKQQESLGTLNGVIKEGVKGQKVLRVFGAEHHFFERFEKANASLKHNGIKAQAVSSSMTGIMNFINNASFAIVVLIGGILAARDYITIGLITSFINYARQFTRPLGQLAGQYSQIQSAMASTDRVFEILNEESEANIDDPIDKSYSIDGEVIFKDVSFSYDKKVPILRNISFNIKPGKTMAIVGPTGSGKTTIINLLTRFYEIDEGKIYVDDKSIKDIPKNQLRSRLGIVLQNNYIFSGTIKDNILYGKEDATNEEVINAAKAANVHDFIESMPNGYDTKVGKGGGILSEGQKQLLSIARTILSDPDVLILDEATSSIDTKTELQVQNALSKLMSHRTSFVIAHRLKTIKNADTILVIKAGEKIEEGNHNELMDKEGFYYTLYTSQMKNMK